MVFQVLFFYELNVYYEIGSIQRYEIISQLSKSTHGHFQINFILENHLHF
jgi:hypothetical protein